MAVGNTRVVQVTNIAPQATKDQMQILFGYLGKIEDIRLYPTIRDVSCPVQSRICYVKFVDSSTVGIAQHMTNTVFIDRALIVIPVQNGEIPDEYYALEMTRNGTVVPGLNVNEPKMPPHVVNSVQGAGTEQVILTSDPCLDSNGLPPYPPLPATYDSVKTEETRRTILVTNVDPSATNDEIIEFFTAAGEVKYLRTCKRQSDEEGSHMLIEFTEQPSIIQSLKMNGQEFKGRTLEIQHATQAIVKPQAKSNEAAQKEIEEAMSRFKEAQNMINASIEPVIGMLTKDKRSSRRSRSRSRGRRRRSRSRSRSRRSRSRRRRSRSRSRRRTRSRERRRRSKSRSRRRSRSRSRGSRSRRSRSRRSRSKSSTRRRSRHRSRDKDSRAKSRDRKSKERDRSKERKRSSRDRDRKSKEKERPKSKEKERTPRESKEKKSDKESSVEAGGASAAAEKKRSRSRSRNRSRSRDRRSRDKRRSRSRGSRRRTPSPKGSRKRTSRSRSRERRKDRKERDRRDRDRKRERSRSRSKVPRNYDEEEKGFDTDKDKEKATSMQMESESLGEKDSSEKSDNMDISNSP